jgi:hypothetical protein
MTTARVASHGGVERRARKYAALCRRVFTDAKLARGAKDVLAQANSQLIFHPANLEDLASVRESFEAAGEQFLADLPHLDTGVAAAISQARPLAEEDGLVVFAGPAAEVTLRREDGGYVLDVDCEDGELAARLRAAVEAALVAARAEPS